MSNAAHIDILGLGAVAVDELLYVDRFPEANQKVQLQCRKRKCGGLTGTALITAARLGSKCAYAGVLGRDDLSELVISNFIDEGVDISSLVRQDAARPFHSTIIVDTGRQTRSILFDAEGVVGAICDSPSADLIRSVHVLFVDHVGSDGMIRAAKIAKNAGVAIVGDFEGGEASRLSKLLELVDHLILPLEFASKLTDAPDPAGAVRSLWNDTRETVVVTMGDRGCLYMTGSQSDCVKHQLAFKVRAVDITGCGDVFHGAYASALARGLDIFERIRFASAASAIKAVNLGGQNGIPNCSAVEEFLKNH